MSSNSVCRCDVEGCGRFENLWKISSTPDTVPQVQPFTLCHKDLGEKYHDIHQALGLGRFHNQKGTIVTYNAWILEKQVSTWKNDSWEVCSECYRFDELWKNVWKNDDHEHHLFGGFQCKYICNGHLPRKSIGNNPTISNGRPVSGISPEEETWNLKV